MSPKKANREANPMHKNDSYHPKNHNKTPVAFPDINFCLISVDLIPSHDDVRPVFPHY